MALAFLAASCRDAAPGPVPSATAAPLATLAAPPPRPVDTRAVEDELSTRPMELLRFRFTSGIEQREPKDELKAARPGQKVFAFLAIRNRTGQKRTVTLAWTVGGEARTTLDLDIDESWQFRTWGYNTVSAKDRGALRLEVTDDAGNVLVEEELPIRP